MQCDGSYDIKGYTLLWKQSGRHLYDSSAWEVGSYYQEGFLVGVTIVEGLKVTRTETTVTGPVPRSEKSPSGNRERSDKTNP